MAKKPKPPKPPYRVVLWSGGKDSTATLILAHEKGEPIDLVLMSLMWFDKKRGIPAENKKHLDWVMTYAKPLIESWGYKVKFVSSDKDYTVTLPHQDFRAPVGLYFPTVSKILIIASCIKSRANSLSPTYLIQSA